MSASEDERPPLAAVYRPRYADIELAARLGATGAVLIEGPRGCGKSETARQVARSEDRPGRPGSALGRSRLDDPSLAAAALDARPERLVKDVGTLGLLPESLVVRDLRIYAQAVDATVFHYRDNNGLEADAIVQGRDGRWAAFEVKLGQAALDLAATDLLRLAARIDTEKHGPPAALAVITGWVMPTAGQTALP